VFHSMIARNHIGQYFLVSVSDVRRRVRVIDRRGYEKCLRHGATLCSIVQQTAGRIVVGQAPRLPALPVARVAVHACARGPQGRGYSFTLRNRRAFAITETELKLIAAPAIIGLRSKPKNGYSRPAAIGTPSVLYMNAKNRFCRMLRITARLRCIALTMPIRSPFTSVIPALSMATSVPVPIAIPTSAAASAGASLIPSPAIATIAPL